MKVLEAYTIATPISNQTTARKLTYEEFGGVFSSSLGWLMKTYGLNDIQQIRILDVTKIYETLHEKGLPQTQQDPDQPPQSGIPLQQHSAPWDEQTTDSLSQQFQADAARFERLYPFLITSAKEAISSKDSTPPDLLFVPEFLNDTSPWVKNFPRLAKDLGVQAVVFMRHEHGGDFDVVNIDAAE